MARIFITGSTEGLGRNAAEELLDAGHDVVVHARNQQRAAALDDLVARGADLVVGDLAQTEDAKELAEAVNSLGRMDAVIHNAGAANNPKSTHPGNPKALLPVNVVAPYLLTALIERPSRLVYLSSGMHLSGQPGLSGIDWSGEQETRTYADSKLLLTTLVFHIACLWPHVLSNAVCPGWVPTRMGGPAATDDLTLGHKTQTWLAVSDDPEAQVSGEYWHHQQRQDPHPATRDPQLQQELAAALADHTGVPLKP